MGESKEHFNFCPTESRLQYYRLNLFSVSSSKIRLWIKIIKMAISIQIIGQIKSDVRSADMLILAKDTNISNAVQVTDNLKPDIILLDYNLMQNKSYIFVSSLSLANRESKIILVGNNIIDYQIVKCLMAGVFGYLESKDLEIFLIQAIRAVDSGEAWVSRQILTKLIGTVSG